MSGYPQGPYGNPPHSPQSTQPPQYPAGYGQPGVMQVPKTSGAAVTALVMGLLLCVPGVTGLGAVLFGIIGIVKTGSPTVRGRGLAIAGLILGLLNIVAWGGVAAAVVPKIPKIVAALKDTEVDRKLAKSFVQNLADGKVAEAAALCDPNVDTTPLAALSATVKAAGPINDMTAVGVNVQTSSSAAGSTKVTIVTVIMQRQNGNKQAQITIEDHPDGTRQIIKWEFLP